MKSLKLVPLMVAASIVAGCSSSGGGSYSFNDVVGKLRTIEENPDAVEQIAADDLPSSAEMTGFVGVETDEDAAVIGDVTATADFDAGTLTGTASNFTEYEISGTEDNLTGERVQNLDGTLDLDGTITSGALETTFTGDLTGTLTGTTDEPGTETDLTADVDLEVAGNFGTMDGTLIAVGEVEGDVDVTVDGFGTETITTNGGILYLEE